MAIGTLQDLDRYKQEGTFGAGYPAGVRVFYSPVDDVHGALVAVIGSATVSLDIAMYGFDDQELADLVEAACKNPTITVTLTFDQSQAGGVHEKLILNREQYPATSIAIGVSEKGAIMHLKAAVVDGRWCVKGSTNWSAGGESAQDNELLVFDNPVLAAETCARIGKVHAHMLAAHQPSSAAELAAMISEAPTDRA